MAIIRWRPFDVGSIFDDDLDLPTIPGISNLMGQGLNIYETDEAIIAEAALPGVPEEKIDVTIDDDRVRISGSREERKEEKDKRRYFMSSISDSYNYSFRLPKGTIKDVEPICELDNGVLCLTFPKMERKPPRKIKIAKHARGAKLV